MLRLLNFFTGGSNMFGLLSGLAASSTTTVVSTAISGVDLTGILNEVVSLLPICLPLMITFIGIRKGISFLIGSLRRA